MSVTPKYLITVVLVGCLVVQGIVLYADSQQIASLTHELEIARQTAGARKQQIVELLAIQSVLSQRKDVLEVTVTAYNPTTDQCDEDPMIAASMRKVREGTVAVSRDLFDRGWVFGKKVRIEGLGIFEINDLMNSRYSKSVDIFMWDGDEAKSFGRQQRKIALLGI